MIESLTLKNFQAHSDTHIDFHKGINVFTGSSTAGKSSLIRSIYWIYSNNPRGNGIVSYANRDKKGEPVNETSATIRVDNQPVKRTKDAKRNGYDIHGQELGAIGSGVPEVVLSALNMSALTFQSQHSLHFLLSQTSGEVSTFLNTVLKLSVIDETLDKVMERYNAVKRKDKSVSEEMEQVGVKLLAIEYVDTLEEVTTDYFAVDDGHTKLKESYSQLVLLRDSVRQKMDQQELLKKYIDAMNPVLAEYSAKTDLLAQRKVSCTELWSLLDRIGDYLLALTMDRGFFAVKPLLAEAIEKDAVVKKVATSIRELTDIADTIKLLTTKQEKLACLPKLSEAVNAGYAVRQEVNKLYEDMLPLRDTIARIRAARETIVGLDDAIADLKSKMPSTCPTCGKPLGVK